MSKKGKNQEQEQGNGLTVARLQSAGKDLVAALGLQGFKVETDDEAALKAEFARLNEGDGVVARTDKLEPDTWKVLEELQIKVIGEMPGAAAESASGAAKGGKKGKAKAAKAVKEGGEAKRPRSSGKVTWMQAVGYAVKSGVKSIDLLTEKTDDAYVKGGGSSNPRLSRVMVRNGIDLLQALGLGEIDGKNFTYTPKGA